MKKVPNMLTILRLILVPVFIYFYSYIKNTPVAAFIFLGAGLTDVLDGYIARKFNAQTQFGALFDPFADKLLQLTATMCVAMSGNIYMWVVFWILLAKEIAMITGATKLYRKRNVVIPAIWYGKLSSILLFAILFFIIYSGSTMSDHVNLWMTIVAITAILLAGVGYLMNYLKTFSKKQGM